MWKHLRERFHTVKVHILHPRIPKSSSVDILRGVPEGSRLSPTLFGIFVADWIHDLKVQFPNATITHNGGFRWIGGILYVDDLCLISTDAREPIPSAMTSTTQTPPYAAHQLKCLTFRNHVSSHTSSSTFATYQMRHNLRHFRLASTSHSAPPCIPQHYFLKQVFPPYTSHKICNLHNADSRCTPPPPP